MCGSRASVPATHTVLSCTAGRPPVDQSLCHHDYRTPHPTVRRLVPCRLTHRSCCRRYAYTVEWPQYRGPRHAYSQQGRGPHVAAWAYDTAAAAATMALAVGLYLLILLLLAQSMDQHPTKPILVCRGHAMYTPTLIACMKPFFEFLRHKLQELSFIY